MQVWTWSQALPLHTPPHLHANPAPYMYPRGPHTGATPRGQASSTQALEVFSGSAAGGHPGALAWTLGPIPGPGSDICHKSTPRPCRLGARDVERIQYLLAGTPAVMNKQRQRRRKDGARSSSPSEWAGEGALRAAVPPGQRPFPSSAPLHCPSGRALKQSALTNSAGETEGGSMHPSTERGRRRGGRQGSARPLTPGGPWVSRRRKEALAHSSSPTVTHSGHSAPASTQSRRSNRQSLRPGEAPADSQDGEGTPAAHPAQPLRRWEVLPWGSP